MSKSHMHGRVVSIWLHNRGKDTKDVGLHQQNIALGGTTEFLQRVITLRRHSHSYNLWKLLFAIKSLIFHKAVLCILQPQYINYSNCHATLTMLGFIEPKIRAYLQSLNYYCIWATRLNFKLSVARTTYPCAIYPLPILNHIHQKCIAGFQ